MLVLPAHIFTYISGMAIPHRYRATGSVSVKRSQH